MPTTNKIVGSKELIKSNDLPVRYIIASTVIIAIKTVTIGITIPKIDLNVKNKRIIIKEIEVIKNNEISLLILVKYSFCPLILPA